jgi:hypothetical protein
MEARMARRKRDDPYKGFNFRIAIGTVAAAVAGFAIVRKLMPKVSARYLDPKDYVRDIPATGRPIEGVGTAVAAGRAAPKPKGRRASGRKASAVSTRRTRAAKPKRR